MRVKQPNEFFQQILASNGVPYNGLFPIDIEFKALELLGYMGTINDRRRAFYASRTGIVSLTDAIAKNQP